VLDYIKDGYLPDALISFIATLGWNDGTKQEIYTREQLIDKFSLDRVQRSGARFDERRLSWINGSLIRSLTIDELFKRTKPYWPREAADASDDYLKSILAIIQERLKYLAELPGLTRFFFVEPEINSALIKDNKRLNKLPAEDLKRWLNTAIERLGSSDFSATDLTDKLNSLLEETGQKPPVLFSLLRIAVTQSMSSPGLADTMAVLGKQRSLDRLRAQLQPL
ncbi:MAG: glutamate--tRNA ligase family protein, partial [Candidatus Saccharimonadales bacterium]